MLRRIRITPSTVIAVITLVFAATGGAFAATSSSSSTPHATATVAKSKAKPKAKTGPRGPAGPAGKQGVQGPAGATGAAGPQGAAGAKGETGAAGAPGAAGKEGEGEEGKQGKEGPKGQQGDPGTPGTPGTPGATGQPWTPNSVLPSGATETGSWGATPSAGTEALSTISFPIALASELETVPGSEHVHLVPFDPEATGTGNLKNPNSAVTVITASSGEFKVGAGIEDTTSPAAIPPGTVITEVISPTEFRMSLAATADATGDSLKAGNPHGCPAGANATKTSGRSRKPLCLRRRELQRHKNQRPLQAQQRAERRCRHRHRSRPHRRRRLGPQLRMVGASAP